MFLRRYKIRKHERGLKFVDGAFVGVLAEGTHWVLSFSRKVRVDVMSVRDPWIRHELLDVIVKSAMPVDELLVVDLADDERAFVWVDGRFDAILQPGLFGLWTAFRKVEVEVVATCRPFSSMGMRLEPSNASWSTRVTWACSSGKASTSPP